MTLELLAIIKITISPYLVFAILCSIVTLYSIKKRSEYEKQCLKAKAERGQYIC